MKKVFDVWVFDPIRLGQLKHCCHTYFVIAENSDSAEQAVRLEKELRKEHFVRVKASYKIDGDTPIVLNGGHISYYTKDQLARVRGEPARAPKPERRPTLSDKPLGTVQRNVLTSLAGSPYPSGGWMWDTPSGTVRILETLRMRCLVNLAGGNYTINKAGLSVLKATSTVAG